MDLRLTIEHGAITAEIEASDGDDYREVLEELADFAEEHPDFVKSQKTEEDDLGQSNTDSDTTETNLKEFADEPSAGSDIDSGDEEVENKMLRPLLESLDVSEDDFIRTFEVAEDVTPRILAPEKVPGETKSEKFLNAALVISKIWQDCYGEPWLKSSELSDSIEQSGLGERTDYIYSQDGWQRLLNKEGQSRGTKIQPTRLGEDKAEEVITQMVNS